MHELWSPTCARFRDPAQFELTPFAFDKTDCQTVQLGKLKLNWLSATAGEKLAASAGLCDLGLTAISKCENRVKFLETHWNVVDEICAEEIEFIQKFTSTLVYLTPNRDDAFFGNSSFYFAPHVTFISDGTMFFIAPQLLIPRRFGAYGFVENLYHEALHHQVHAYCAQTHSRYCVNEINPFVELLDFPRRQDRTFTLFQAINAYHVYGFLANLRRRVLRHLSKDYANHELAWLESATQEASDLWEEFGASLSRVESKFLPPWREFIADWYSKAQEFREQYHVQVG